MTRFSRLFCSTALTVVLLPQVSAAEVTADDVWQNQKSYLATLGGELVVSSAREGDRLTVSDATLTYQLPFGVGRVAFSLAGYSLLEKDDGTVTITHAQPISYGIAVDITDEGAFSGHIDITTQALSTVASGAPKDVTYTWSVDRMDFQLRDFELISARPANNQVKDFTLVGKANFVDLSGVSRIQVGALVKTNSSFSIGRQEIQFSGEAENTRINFVGGADNFATQSQVTLPRTGMDIMNLAAALRDGLAFQLSSQTNGYYTSYIEEQNGAVTSDETTRLREQSDNYTLDQSGLGFAVTTLGAEFNVQPSKELPFLLKFNLDKAAIDLNLPLSASSELQDFAYLMSLEGLDMADELWDLFDPAKSLPRSPAKLTTDMSGKVLNTLNWLDFLAVTAKMKSGEKSVELYEMKLNTLLVEMAGAKLAGSGAATFDNSNLENLAGFPKPTGVVDLVLSGGNGLLDNLVAMGLLSDQDAIGARMTVAVFTSPDPDAGEDVLKSRLEMTGDGQILANGQRLQ